MHQKGMPIESMYGCNAVRDKRQSWPSLPSWKLLH